jgi:hypothetical protein
MPGSGKNDLSRHGRRRAPLPPELRRVNVNGAGIDIGARHHYVAVPEGRDPEGRARMTVRMFHGRSVRSSRLAVAVWDRDRGDGIHGRLLDPAL